jgi:hypothetical protein
MPALGGGNPLPLQIGGGPSSSEQAYDALRSSVGIGGSGPRDGIMEGWRFAKARGLAAATMDARVFFQWFPGLATDLLPMYEQLLGVPAGPNDSEQDRRARVDALWTRIVSAVTPDLLARLQEIAPSVTIVAPNGVTARRTVPGRGFEDYDPDAFGSSGPAFNIGKQSVFPAYADDYVLYVYYPLPPGSLTDNQRLTIQRLTDVLHESLPAWCQFYIFTQDGGFILDVDLLDLTVFG